jgi:hypothetical protein
MWDELLPIFLPYADDAENPPFASHHQAAIRLTLAGTTYCGSIPRAFDLSQPHQENAAAFASHWLAVLLVERSIITSILLGASTSS